MAWYNPSSWFNNVNVQRDGSDIMYLLTNNGLGQYAGCFNGGYSEHNMVMCFQTIPELFAIVDAIATRVKGGRYTLVKESDGSEVTGNKLWEKISSRPNWQYSFRDFIAHYIFYKYATGNVYGYTFCPGTLALNHNNIQALWLLPSHYVAIKRKAIAPSYLTTLNPADLIEFYQYGGDNSMSDIKPDYVTHQIMLKMNDATDIVTGKGVSIFKAAEYPLSNLVAVYKARNIIYTQRGPGGMIVSKKADAAGMIALTPLEKKEVIEDLTSNYGLSQGKTPFGVSSQPVDWLKTGATISELEPFEETLAATAAIAGVAGVPMALMPKVAENKQTNLDIAERNFYENIITTQADDFCNFLTTACRFGEIGCKVAVSFEHVAALQDDKAKMATAIMNAASGGMQLYNAGKITADELREMVGLAPLPSGGDQFITPEELARLQPVKPNNNGNTDTGKEA